MDSASILLDPGGGIFPPSADFGPSEAPPDLWGSNGIIFLIYFVVEDKIKKEEVLTDVSTQELIDIERMSLLLMTSWSYSEGLVAC